MYRLFHRIRKGLEPVPNMFKQHVIAEGMVLMQQAEDTTNSKVFVRELIELHDKYMAYVTDCFANNSLFHMALEEAFTVFCNKTMSGCSSAELLASYCDYFLKKGGSGKLSYDAIEETLDKVVKLLTYIFDRDLFEEFYRSFLDTCSFIKVPVLTTKVLFNKAKATVWPASYMEDGENGDRLDIG